MRQLFHFLKSLTLIGLWSAVGTNQNWGKGFQRGPIRLCYSHGSGNVLQFLDCPFLALSQRHNTYRVELLSVLCWPRGHIRRRTVWLPFVRTPSFTDAGSVEPVLGGEFSFSACAFFWLSSSCFWKLLLIDRGTPGKASRGLHIY